ncbi:myb-like protein X [Vanessa cardui]|uniref:myb-like protein X n=1 Tax=Vanessa cardui TaxID=171605 RepID=UPI001F147102|nr:myb-like protein X [Vanessa cardui]
MTDAFIHNKTNNSGQVEQNEYKNVTNVNTSNENNLNTPKDSNNTKLSISLQEKHKEGLDDVPQNGAGNTVQKPINSTDGANATIKVTETENNKREKDEQISEKKISYQNTDYNDSAENVKEKVVETQNSKESEENNFDPEEKYTDIPEKTGKGLNRRQESSENESIEQLSPIHTNIHHKRDEDNDEDRQNEKDYKRTSVDSNKEHYDKFKDIPQNTEDESRESKENSEKYSPRQTIVARDRDEGLNAENKYYSRENEFIKDKQSVAVKEDPTETKSSEDSREDYIENRKQNTLHKDYASDPPTKEIIRPQEADLDDFSDESVEVDDQVKDAKDFNINNINNSKAKNQLILKDENNSNQIKDNSNEYEDHVKINDGEVKPVIELNSEDSDEESEENLNESVKAPLRDNDEKRFNVDLENEPPNDEKVNVKQQFERIPLNYNHDLKKTNTSKNEQESSDGTLDTISPKKDNFDDNLNIKFSDITIKLPEINLPDDILSYAREDEEQTEDDESNKSTDENKKENKDGDDFYQSYYYKPKENLKKSNQVNTYDEHDINNDEDPYEKFVRERFGKSKTFRQRSEKLQEFGPNERNPNLQEKIQNVLKKANYIQKEAEKSGDPKAGYLWTLEYEENL